MKKIILTTLLIFIFLSATVCTVKAESGGKGKPVEVKKPVIYGMVFVFDKMPDFIYALLNAEVLTPDVEITLILKPLILINKGKIIEAVFRIGRKSYVRVYYNRHIYKFDLQFYKIGNNFIMWTFTGIPD